MKIGTYISELLFDHETVLLPGFGEFATKYIPARFIPEEKKIESPKKVITFNAERTDGASPLVAYIAGKELKDLDQVNEYLGNFVREIHETLSHGNKVELERIGVFSRDADGNLRFDPNLGINYLADAAGLKTISEPPKAVVPPPPVKDPEPVTEIESPEESPVPEPPQEEYRPEPEPEPIEEPAEKKGTEPVEASPVYAAGTEPARHDLPKAIKWLAWVIIPFLVILIILAFNWRFIFGKKDQALAPVAQTELSAPAPETAPATETPAPGSISPVETPAAAASAPATAQPTAQPTPGQKTYFIVVGAFQDQDQANSLVNDLRGQGASQAQIFMTTSTGFHRVCYAFFTDLKEAEAALPRVQQEVNPGAWILHRN